MKNFVPEIRLQRVDFMIGSISLETLTKALCKYFTFLHVAPLIATFGVVPRHSRVKKNCFLFLGAHTATVAPDTCKTTGGEET